MNVLPKYCYKKLFDERINSVPMCTGEKNVKLNKNSFCSINIFQIHKNATKFESKGRIFQLDI